MRVYDVELLDDDLDEPPILTRAELGLPIDLTREDLDDTIDDDDELGFRALYVNPEVVLGDAAEL